MKAFLFCFPSVPSVPHCGIPTWIFLSVSHKSARRTAMSFIIWFGSSRGEFLRHVVEWICSLFIFKHLATTLNPDLQSDHYGHWLNFCKQSRNQNSSLGIMVAFFNHFWCYNILLQILGKQLAWLLVLRQLSIIYLLWKIAFAASLPAYYPA